MIVQTVSLIVVALLVYVVLIPYIRYKLYARQLPADALVEDFFPIMSQYIRLYKNSQANAYAFFQKTNQLYKGRSCVLTTFMRNNLLILLEPRYLKEYHNKQTKSFKKYPGLFNLLRESLGRGLASLQGKQHTDRRIVMSEIFSYGYLNFLTKKIFQIIKTNMDRLQGKQVFVLKEVAKMTSEIIVSCFVGDFNTSDIYIEGRHISQLANELFINAFQQMTTTHYMLTGNSSPNYKDLCDRFQGVFKDLVNKGLNQQDKKDNQKYLVSLIYEKNIGATKQENLQIVTCNFQSFFVAGSGTVAHLVTASVYFLNKYPNLASQIKEQISDFDFENLNGNSGKDYLILNSFIKQVQRMLGPGNGNYFRESVQDVYLDDLFVPKGTVIYVGSDMNMFNDTIYKNPYEFNIERWFGYQKLDPYAFLPFSAGPRNCIGQHLSLFETRLALIYLLHTYDMQIDRTVEPIVKMKGLLRFDPPVKVKFSKKAK